MGSESSCLTVLDKHLCSGCGACSQVCARGALQMIEDDEGFLYPQIDLKKCVHCGACQRVCPIANDDKSNDAKNQQCFLATKTPKEYYKRSATIGLCTKIAHDVLRDGGSVVGVKMDEKKWQPQHVMINKLDQLDLIRNSKYAQSRTLNTYSEIKRQLANDEHVLFVGTPCQVAGLKAFLNKDYSNLTTVDIICHGTFSYKLLQREIAYWEKKYKGQIKNFYFRSKRFYPWSMGGVVNFDMEKNGRVFHIEKHARLSPTYRCFAYSGDGVSYNIRPSCYKCAFRNRGRYGDLTIGDAWGVSEFESRFFSIGNCYKGVSLVVGNTKKGLEWVHKLKDFCKWDEIPMDHGFVQPALLPTNRVMPEKRARLYENVSDEDYVHVVEDVLNVDFKKLAVKEVVIDFKRLVKKPLINLVKKILFRREVKQWV